MQERVCIIQLVSQDPSQKEVFFEICYFIFFYKFIYLFLAVLGLHCCTWAFSSCGERGLLFIAVQGLLIAVASLVEEHGLYAHGLQQLWTVGSVVVARRLQSTASVVVAHSTWDPPGPGLEPVSPALAGGFLTTAPPGKPAICCFTQFCLSSHFPFPKFEISLDLCIIKINIEYLSCAMIW